MPQIRQNINGVIYFITSCTRNNKKLFSEREFCEILIKNINFYRIKLQFRLYAFCIIPWHFHLLIMPDKVNVSKIMQLIKYRTASDIRKHHNRNREPGSRLPASGTVWQKSFYDRIIRSDKELEKHY